MGGLVLVDNWVGMSQSWLFLVVAAHRLAVDDAGARAQPGERLHDQREPVGEVVAGAAVERHPLRRA